MLCQYGTLTALLVQCFYSKDAFLAEVLLQLYYITLFSVFIVLCIFYIEGFLSI